MHGLDDVAVFVKVVQAGSFTQAAKLLSMPNTTVSAKVAALEKRLGVTLIQRTTRKLNVTQAGEAYFRRCVQALDEIRIAETEVTSSQAEPQGILRITSAVDVGQTLLPAMVRAYLKEFPKMEVDLLVTNRVVDLVAEGVDLGIRAGELDDSSMIAKKLVSGHICFWATPGYLKKNGAPTHPKELARHEMVCFSPIDFSKTSLTNGKDKFVISPKGRVSVDDLAVVKSFVLQGERIGLLPFFVCEEESKKGKLVPILPQWVLESDSFSIVYPAQRFVSPKVQAFIRIATEVGRSHSFPER